MSDPEIQRETDADTLDWLLTELSHLVRATRPCADDEAAFAEWINWIETKLRIHASAVVELAERLDRDEAVARLTAAKAREHELLTPPIDDANTGRH
jgi:hypothetical protein